MPALSFSGLCAALGCDLTNVLDRWSGYSGAKKRAVFTVWADRLKNGRYLFIQKNSQDTRVGARELRDHINAVMATGAEALGILCEAKDVNSNPRSRKRVHTDFVLVLRFAIESDGLVAYVAGRVPVNLAIAGKVAQGTRPMDSAVDDINEPPLGNENPKKSGRFVSGYPRDPKIREAVRRRARGVCEYCHACEFSTADGRPYLETHHVIKLAKQGADTMRNVIALCSRHHKEAHYGKEASALERKFLLILKGINGTA